MEGLTAYKTKGLSTSKPIQCNMTFEGEPNFDVVKEIQKEIEKIGAGYKKLRDLGISPQTQLSSTYTRIDIDVITLEYLSGLLNPQRGLSTETHYRYGLRKNLWAKIDCCGFDVFVKLYSPLLEINFETKKP